MIRLGFTLFVGGSPETITTLEITTEVSKWME